MVAELLKHFLVRVYIPVRILPIWILLEVGFDDQALNLLPIVFLAECFFNVPLSFLELLLFDDFLN